MIPNNKYLPEVILHEKYFNPNYDINGNQLYGMAPLRAGLKRLQKSNSQLTAETATWNNEGIKGIVHMKHKIGEVEPESAVNEVASLAETIRQEWSGSSNRGKMGASAYDLGWIPIGLNAEEMLMIESGWVDVQMLCNIFGGVPSRLLNDPKGSTYNNVTEAEKSLTTRCVLPELCSTKDCLNRKAASEWGLPVGGIIDFDMSYFAELQEDVGKVADWTSKLVAIIPDEQREQCGLAATGDPIMSQVWVMQGGNRVPLKDMQMNEVDNALQEDLLDNPIPKKSIINIYADLVQNKP
jgi:phage portal protein BeeE